MTHHHTIHIPMVQQCHHFDIKLETKAREYKVYPLGNIIWGCLIYQC